MKNVNNKILIIVFISLVLIFVLSKLFRSPERSNNFDARAFQIDTSRITEIRLLPSKDSMVETRLIRTSNQWNAIHKDITAQAAHNRIKGLLTALAALSPERIVSRKKEKWNDYALDDLTATSLSIFERDKRVFEMKVGKTTGGSTYARTGDGDEVYSLEGNLQSTFNVPFKEWRNQAFTRLTKNSIYKIEFQYPADSSFILERQNRQWMINGKAVDTVKVDTYLNKISHQDLDSFADHFSPVTEPEATVIFKTDTNQNFFIKGWKHSTGQWILNSASQPNVYFSEDDVMGPTKIFPGKRQFEIAQKLK
jgi:hypothetical protein